MARTNSDWILWVFLVALAAIGASPALAQNDRIYDTPTGWSYLYGVTPSQISGQIAAGLRPFSLENVGTAPTTLSLSATRAPTPSRARPSRTRAPPRRCPATSPRTT